MSRAAAAAAASSTSPLLPPPLPLPSTAATNLMDDGDDDGGFDDDLPSQPLRQLIIDDPQRMAKFMISGAVAGAVSRTATAPIDRLKLLLQVNDSARAMTVREGIRSMLAEGTPLAFFRGNGANVLKIAPETALKLTFNDRIKRAVAYSSSSSNSSRSTESALSPPAPISLTPAERFVAGASAGALAQTVIYPLELIRTRLAICPKGTYRGIADAAARVLRNEGPRAFYRGLAPSLMGILPYAGVDIAAFETLKEALLDAYEPRGEPPPPAAIIAAGAVSSSVAQLTAYPLALVRTRLQAQGSGGRPIKYSGMFDVIRKTVASEGVRGLYKGVIPNLLKMAPCAGISWFVFEETKSALGLDRHS